MAGDSRRPSHCRLIRHETKPPNEGFGGLESAGNGYLTLVRDSPAKPLFEGSPFRLVPPIMRGSTRHSSPKRRSEVSRAESRRRRLRDATTRPLRTLKRGTPDSCIPLPRDVAKLHSLEGPLIGVRTYVRTNRRSSLARVSLGRGHGVGGRPLEISSRLQLCEASQKDGHPPFPRADPSK